MVEDESLNKKRTVSPETARLSGTINMGKTILDNVREDLRKL